MGVKLDRTYEVIDKLNRAVTSHDICVALTGFAGCYGLTSMIAATMPSPTEHTKAA